MIFHYHNHDLFIWSSLSQLQESHYWSNEKSIYRIKTQNSQQTKKEEEEEHQTAIIPHEDKSKFQEKKITEINIDIYCVYVYLELANSWMTPSSEMVMRPTSASQRTASSWAFLNNPFRLLQIAPCLLPTFSAFFFFVSKFLNPPM